MGVLDREIKSGPSCEDIPLTIIECFKEIRALTAELDGSCPESYRDVILRCIKERIYCIAHVTKNVADMSCVFGCRDKKQLCDIVDYIKIEIQSLDDDIRRRLTYALERAGVVV